MSLPTSDQEYEERRLALRPRLTDEFLATLVEAAELTLFDDVEVGGFVSEVFQMAGKIESAPK